MLAKNAQVYSDLPQGPSRIRVLRLSPGRCEEEITCDLIEEPLPLVEFEALSYFWGVTLRPYAIKVNEKPFYIGYNLYSALKELRNTEHERLLWVDAVCINQHDDTEKSNQVQMMRDIFSKASKVVVWLGESAPATGSMFEFVRQFGNAKTEETDTLWGNHTTQSTWMSMQKEYLRIFRHDWWRRAWVVQEVVVGRHVVMQCGAFQVDWEAMHKLFTYGPFANDLFRGYRPPSFAKYIQSLREEANDAEDSGVTLGDLVIRFRLQSATFGSDKIYALLGLLHSDNPSLITPDYSKPPDEVFLQFTESCLVHMKNLDILSYAPGAQLHDASWCRDWRLNYDHPFLFKAKRLLDLESSRPFSASGRHPPSFAINLEHRILTVAGCKIDVVARTGIVPVREPWQKIDWGQILRSWERVADEELGHTETSALRESFNRAVTADCWQIEPTDWRRRIKPPQDDPCDDEDKKYRLAVYNACICRRFFVTKNGMFGLGPWDMKRGDTVSVLLGGKIPFILRRCVNRSPARIPSATYHKLVGEAFVDGLMYQDEGLQDDRLRDFRLI
ncbi:hypothetical protein COCMIDRAFT_106492 [Bipolaris oryzae ATCC 44560]|uniref:Heterokaryon incompatibility domain-containing protein n=1 Tax=Bipolaris oryzae ATCC 44560 TaxID=930090 RepID=W6YUT6_COCMI|nr:uncharacterized protein COCMIDRAFT_106492 [Bipolaris oryzae ATCC 44560]EUC41320.1 hypothetical protein COCMIDRAFT_106492 [Bipolaris oryzae ATCC 44560]